MNTSKLNPILNKEAILKTANARELAVSPNDVLQRYNTYANTHVPLGDTTKQLTNLQRVIVENKTCAVGTIVGPYGYGKTSTAVHLWHEIKSQNIIAVPPFLWKTLDELMDAVYHWIRFEFSQGPKKFLHELEGVYDKHRQEHIESLAKDAGRHIVDKWVSEGRLSLKVNASDVVGFFTDATEVCEKAGYKGLVVFTDELQATLASYSSRDEFFADLFDLVKDILGLAGHWALVITMDDGTEGTFARMRADLLQRLQRSALHFRVKDVYNRREYPSELWHAFEKRFKFDGSKVIMNEALESIGQVASRSDLGAGPRTVTNAMALAIKHYEKSNQPYSPLSFVEDFLAGQVVFDQRGKFGTAVRKALDNPEVRDSEENQNLIKFLSAYPLGCTEKLLNQFGFAETFHNFPGLARRELIAQLSGGFILRALSEEEIPPEQIEQRLVKEFVARFSPSKAYAQSAADGFLKQVLIDSTFSGWKTESSGDLNLADNSYKFVLLRGTFDPKYPERLVNIMTTIVPQSSPPNYDKSHPDADLEIRFELNYKIAPGEPSRLLVSFADPQVAVFQLNITSNNPELANKNLPNFLLEYYAPDQFTPLLCLSLSDFLFRNQGSSPDDKSRVNTVIAPLRQFSLSLLLGDSIEVTNSEFASGMVGADRIKEVFRQQCRKLYPDYKTLLIDKNWQTYIQQYQYAIEKVATEDGISMARGRQPWVTTKEDVAGALRIPGRKLTTLEVILDSLSKAGVLEKIQFSGRSTSSEVSLLLKLHPLEEDWLNKLDNSKQHTHYKGVEAPSLPADVLMQQSRALGYTLSEIQEVIHLLVARKYIDLDKKRNAFVRTIDSVDDLRSSVQALVDNLDKDISLLSAELPDFDDRFYPTAKLKSDLGKAKERDEFERIRAEVRRLSGALNGFVGKRFESLRQSLSKELDDIYNSVRQGIPMWLSNSYPASPLSEILERQKNSLVSAYQGTLDEMRLERESSFKKAQDATSQSPKGLVQVYALYRDLSDKGRKLRTRLQSYQDKREELEAWWNINKLASDVDIRAKNIYQVYEYSEFNELAQKLWKEIKESSVTDPLSFVSRHVRIREQIEALEQRISTWVENQRSDFENKRIFYQTALKDLGVNADIRVPFDSEHPAESSNVLHDQVSTLVQQHIGSMAVRLNHILEVSEFAIKVQKLGLQSQQVQAQSLIDEISRLGTDFSADKISDPEQFNTYVIAPIQKVIKEEKALYQAVRKSLKPGKPKGPELALYDILVKSNGQMDLRSLITSLLEKGDENIDLDNIMQNIKSLFQKNLIDIRLNALDSQEDK
jgi:hypothetical protein